MKPEPGNALKAFTASAPSKSFWLGEYSVLKGRPALLGAHSPRFTLNARFGDGEHAPLPFSEKSPAGLLWHKALSRHPELSSASAFSFSGGSEGGGFGASTAQFLLLYWALAQAGFLDLPLNWLSAYDCYRELTKKETLPPSGADLVSQWKGGLTLFHPSERIAAEVLPLFEGSCILIFTAAHLGNRKTQTHEHLASLKPDFLSETNASRLSNATLMGMEALQTDEPRLLGQAFLDTADQLWNLGLECKEAHEDRKAVEGLPGVLGVKGMGALLSDGLIVVLDRRLPQKERGSLIDGITRERGLKILVDGFHPEFGVHA
jgi:hypothetical protein